MVCRSNILGRYPDSECFPGLALRRSLERVVFSFCSILGLGDVGEQLDEPHGRLLQGATRSQPFLNVEWVASIRLQPLERIDPGSSTASHPPGRVIGYT